MRKASRRAWLGSWPAVSSEQGEIGPDLFRHTCLMGLEGMISKHRESTYRGGRFLHWTKRKKRQYPAFSRVQDQSGNSAGTVACDALRSQRTMDSLQNA